MNRPQRKTRVVSVRVPEGLPAKVKAMTGLSFSAAVNEFFSAFIASQTHSEEPSNDQPN